MNLQTMLRRAVPHLLICAGFVLAIAVYFNPLVFKGYNLRQGDTGQWAGAAEEVIKHRNQFHEEPLWSNGMFSGMPAYVISVVYPGEAVSYVENALQLGLPYPASILLVSLFCYYILMLALGQKPPAAALGALAFTFFTFSFVSIEAGHNSKVRAMAMAPLVLAGIVYMYRDRRWLGFALTALGMALHIHAGHYQVTYYLAIFCIFIGVGMFIEAVRNKALPTFPIQSLLLVAAAGLGTGANAGRLLTLQEYAPYSMRGKSELTPKEAANPGEQTKPSDGGLDRDYVFRWSNEKMETFTLLVPSFRGGGSQEPIDKGGATAKFMRSQNYDLSQVPALPLYWGDQPFTSGPVYAGAIICFLAVLGLTVLPGATPVWLGLAILFSVVLTWGKHWEGFNYFMYDHFPAYRQFRSVTMAIVIAQWALPWLGVLGLGRFINLAESASEKVDKDKLKKQLYLAAGIVGGLLLVFAVVPSIAGNFETPNDAQMQNPQLVSAMMEDRESMLRSDSFRSLFFVLAAVALLFSILRGWMKAYLAVTALAVLVLADLWSVNSRYLNKDSFQKNYYAQRFTPSAADQRMSQALPYHEYRVLNLRDPFNETQTSYFHQSLGGYSPAKLRRYQDLIEGPLSANIQALPTLLNSGAPVDSAFGQAPVLNMLNTRFVKFGDKAEEVLENPKACGTAWFVQTVKSVKTPDEEITALQAPGWDPAREAIVDASRYPTKSALYNTQGATATCKDWRSNRITYEASTPGPGLLVMSENFYEKGWKATVDGKEMPLIRVDYTLRGLDLPEGTHTIVCSFEPGSFTFGNLISTVSSLLIYALLAWALYRAYVRQAQADSLPA